MTSKQKATGLFLFGFICFIPFVWTMIMTCIPNHHHPEKDLKVMGITGILTIIGLILLFAGKRQYNKPQKGYLYQE